MRQRLLTLARAALISRVCGTGIPDVADDLDLPVSGVFVTVYCRGELRGCLGTLEDRQPLAAAVVRLAAEAACNDDRFPPIEVHELDHVQLHLSLLGPPEAVDPTEVVVGRDGLIVEDGARRGLLLPQVPVEHGWDRETFLARACVKAGLRPDAWRNGARLLRFEAEVFGDGRDAPSR